jgi:hypothetical protein
MLIKADLSIDEWGDLAACIGEVATSVAFIVGDWLVYGQNLFSMNGINDVRVGRVDHPSYQRAIEATRLDLSTLQNYAYVSRSIPYSMRSERLSWEHHRLLAKLPDNDKQDWIDTCVAEEDAGRRMSTRRLRKSLSLGRVATDADLDPDDADGGIENHIQFINRLSVWWKRMKKENFLTASTREQRGAMLRDFAPITALIQEINHSIQEEDNPGQPLLSLFKQPSNPP